MADGGRKRGDRPKYRRSDSKRSRSSKTKIRLEVDTSGGDCESSDDVVRQFLRRSWSIARSATVTSRPTDSDRHKDDNSRSADDFIGSLRTENRSRDDEEQYDFKNGASSSLVEDGSITDLLDEITVVSSEVESSQEAVTSAHESIRMNVFQSSANDALAIPSTPRTPRLVQRPAGLNNSLERVPSLIFRYDPERISLASSRRSEDRPSALRETAIMGTADDTAMDTTAVDTTTVGAGCIDAAVHLREHDGDKNKKKRKFRFRKSLKKIRKSLVRQPSQDGGERANWSDLQNDNLETRYGHDIEGGEEEEITGSQSSQDSVGVRKKKPGMMQRLSAWFTGKKESAIVPVAQQQTDFEESMFQRKASYHKAINTGRWSGVYVSGSSTDDEASEDDGHEEFSQEIIADSGPPNQEELEEDRERVVDKLEEIGCHIEEQFRDQLIDAVKKLDISAALQYPRFSNVVGALVEGGKMTKAGVMKLLVFGRQLVTGVPQELVSMIEQYTSQAVEEYASDYIRTSGGWGAIADN